MQVGIMCHLEQDKPGALREGTGPPIQGDPFLPGREHWRHPGPDSRCLSLRPALARARFANSFAYPATVVTLRLPQL